MKLFKELPADTATASRGTQPQAAAADAEKLSVQRPSR